MPTPEAPAEPASAEPEASAGQAAEPALAKPKTALWKSLLKAAIAVLFIGGVVYSVVSQWGEVRPLLGKLSLTALGLATLAVFVGVYATFMAWRAIMTDLGFPLGHNAGMRVFFVSQLGKYVPGKLWPILMQMRLGRAYQIPVRASGAAALVFLLMVIGSGLVVAVPTLPLFGGNAWGTYWWTALILVAAIVVALPPVLNRLIALGLRLTRREPLPQPMTFRGITIAALWSLVAWFAYGVHIWVLAGDLGAQHSFWLYVISTGGFAAAFSAGFLLPVAPAGAGAREWAMILLFAVVLTKPQVLVIAVISRLLFTLMDVAWAGIGALVRPPADADQGPARG